MTPQEILVTAAVAAVPHLDVVVADVVGKLGEVAEEAVVVEIRSRKSPRISRSGKRSGKEVIFLRNALKKQVKEEFQKVTLKTH